MCDSIEAVSPTYNCPADGCPTLPTPRACQPHPPPAPPPLADGAPIVVEPAHQHPASNKWVMALMAIGLAGAMAIITLCCWIYNVSHYLKNKPTRPQRGNVRRPQGTPLLRQQALAGKGAVGAVDKQGGGGSGGAEAPAGGKGPAAAAKGTSSGSVSIMALAARGTGRSKKVQAGAGAGAGASAAGAASGVSAGNAGSTAKMARAASSNGSSSQGRGQAGTGAGRPPMQSNPSGGLQAC